MRVLLVAFLLLSGCTSVSVTNLRPSQAKPDRCQIQVFGTESEVKDKFESVCILTVESGRALSTVIEKSKPDACRCGGDGIIVGEMGRNSWDQKILNLRVIKFQ